MEKKEASDEMSIVTSDNLAFSLIFKQERLKKQETKEKRARAKVNFDQDSYQLPRCFFIYPGPNSVMSQGAFLKYIIQLFSALSVCAKQEEEI